MFFNNWAGLGRVALISILAYMALILLLRVSGKRTLSKMNAFDLVVTVDSLVSPGTVLPIHIFRDDNFFNVTTGGTVSAPAAGMRPDLLQYVVPAILGAHLGLIVFSMLSSAQFNKVVSAFLVVSGAAMSLKAL